MPLQPAFTPERLEAIEADVAADRFADVTFRRGYGGQFDRTWNGEDSLPVKVAATMKGEASILLSELSFVRDLDERTALYARP